MSEIEIYEDPIILLANDPDLNKEKAKSAKLVELIHNFPLTERKVSKLCSLSLIILQNLEKIELNLKSWAFLSLDINSNDHFNNETDSIKDFNNSISIKVLQECKVLNVKLGKISNDLDHITKESRTLSPIEYISDSGTLLTSLNLRNIKLKFELTDKITVSYSKAKLINIGMELELMLIDDDEDLSTINTYKTFVANLLKQLNNTIDNEDMTGKTECLAVINDMEKMFDAFKLEKLQANELQLQKEREELEKEKEIQRERESHQRKLERQRYKSPEPYVNIKYEQPSSNSHSHSHSRSNSDSPIYPPRNIDDVVDDDSSYDSDMGSSMGSSMFTYNSPMIHSITKSQPTSQLHPIKEDMMNSSILHKTTLSEEMPYLLSAFNSAKNVEEDIKNFKEETPESKSKKSKAKPKSPLSKETEDSDDHSLHFSKSHLPETQLTSQSTLLPSPSPYSYLYSNNSLLSRLGIKPQVITTEIPKDTSLSLNTTSNIQQFKKPLIKNDDNEKNDKENLPLTQMNLRNHLSSLSIKPNEFNDQVE
ncbi:hypothetical protein CLIB1444_02S01574 [[Candida] jaroonii]|uniref:Uncharacterized protein n=1 Tax=[Candida] jaroonii TaxID=467808 RepID=A0ACA9Y2R2_9ASCO|nr:hypothetical protein CLIB1444_02S01574 [[Candida] jaroonii]